MPEQPGQKRGGEEMRVIGSANEEVPFGNLTSMLPDAVGQLVVADEGWIRLHRMTTTPTAGVEMQRSGMVTLPSSVADIVQWLRF